MRAPARIGLYGLVLAITFAVAATTAKAVVTGEASRLTLRDEGTDHDH